jgi:hypothetical protein
MIKPMHPFMIFLLDLWCWVKSLLCIIRRRHKDSRPVLEAKRAGKGVFRAVPMQQCAFCGTLWIRQSDAEKLGASRPTFG